MEEGPNIFDSDEEPNDANQSSTHRLTQEIEMEKRDVFRNKLNDGSVLFLGTKGMMKAIDAFEGEMLRSNLDVAKEAHGHVIYTIAVSKKRRRVLCGTTETIFIWSMDELDKFTPYAQSRIHTNLIFGLDVEREKEDFVASISCDERVYIYKWKENENLEKIKQTRLPGGFGWGIAFTIPGHVGYCGSFEGVRDFDFVKEKTRTLSDSKFSKNAYSITYVRRRNCVAIGFKDSRMVNLFDMRSGKCVQTIPSVGSVFSIMITQDSQNLFTGTDTTGTLSCFDLRRTKDSICMEKQAHAAGIPRIVEIDNRRGSFIATCSELYRAFVSRSAGKNHISSGMKLWKRENLENVVTIGCQEYDPEENIDDNLKKSTEDFFNDNPWSRDTYAMAYWGDEGKMSMQARMDESERAEYVMKMKDEIRFVKVKWKNGCGREVEMEIWEWIVNGKNT